MRRCNIVGSLVGLMALAVGAEALGSSPGVVRQVRPQVLASALSPQTVELKVTLKRLECLAESEWDRFSDSDEPCLIVTGFRHPGAMTGNSGYHIYSDVDTGEQRAIAGPIAMAVPPASGYVVHGGTGQPIPAYPAGADLSRTELGPGELVGFDVRILEHDDANEATLTGTIAGMTRDMAETLHSLPSVVGDVLGLLGDVVDGVWHLVDSLADAILGAGDDYVGGHTVVFYRPSATTGDAPPAGPRIPAGAEVINLDELAAGVQEKFFFIDGGSEGLYTVVYEITKTVRETPPATVVQGSPAQAGSGEPTGGLTVQGQAVPQTGRGTVRQVFPRGGDSLPATKSREQGPARATATSLAGVRADRVGPDDFLGDYRLYLDGVPYRLHLLGDRGAALTATVEDMSGHSFEVTDFTTEGNRCQFVIGGLSGKDGRPLLLRGFLLTHTKAELVGTFQVGGRTLGFYATKYKLDSDPTSSRNP